MKVAILSNDFRVYWKGRLTFLQPFLAERGVDLQAIELFGKGSPYSFDKYEGEHGWWQCLFADKSAFELSKQEIAQMLFAALDEMKPDIIIGAPITFYAGALGLRWAKNNGKKFIMFDDAKPLVQFKRGFITRTVRNILTSLADGLWLPSADYSTEYPAINNKQTLFFYGYSTVDNGRFKLDIERTFHHQTILCVARLVPIKNIDGLLKAWQLVEKENKHYQLQIIGNGPEYDQLIALGGDLGLKRVEFLGTVNNTDIPVRYYQADALILPSLSETWGLVVNEAMAAGLPVLLSNKVNAAQSLLQDGVNGYSFSPFDINSMADAILKFIRLDEQTKAAMAGRSLALINQMDYNNMGLQLLDALQVIASRKIRKPGIIARVLVNLWHGKHDTSAWDKL
jgi:glycosyltransferase involved in cell wall biosynthesis